MTPVAQFTSDHRLDLTGLAATLAGVLGLAALGVLTGLGIVLVGKFFALLMVALIGGVFCLFVPLSWVVALLLVLAFLVVGPAQYFGGVDKALWIPYLLGLAIWLRFPMERLRCKGSVPLSALPPHGRFVVGFASMLAVFLIASTIFNLSPVFQIFVAAKEHFFLWSVPLVLAAGLIPQRFMDGVWKALLWLAPAQIPAVLYQRFVITPSRAGTSAWDAVVGLFGGDPDGGGASGAMAITLIFLSMLAVALRQKRIIGSPMLLLVLLSSVISIGLAEVKIALVILPFAFAILFRAEAVRRPLKYISLLAVSLVIAVGGIAVYHAQFSADRTAEGRSMTRYVETIIERQTDTQHINFVTGEMGRGTALRFWWEANGNAGPVSLLLGHGLGSSRLGGVVVGEAAEQYRFRIDRSSLAIYLWEGGVLGALALVSVLICSAAAAARASLRTPTPTSRASLEASVPLLTIVLLLLPYNTDIANVHTLQLLVMLLIGQTLLALRTPAPEA